jgi:hypothetical protein
MDQNNAVAAPAKSNAAKFVFFYLTHLVSLGFMTVSFGMIIFQIINKNIPDAVAYYSGSYSASALRFAISALLVSAPIFYVATSFIEKSLFTGELRKDSAIRRWLTYLVLFVSFLIFIGWLIAFVYNFLDGELTLKFFSKVISVLAIAGAVFSFYIYDIRREAVENIKDKVVKIFFIASLSLVVIVFVSSFFFVESPSEARDRKLDEMVINNFYSIDSCVDQYYTEKQNLPADFAAMQADCQYLTSNQLRDSQTGKDFSYGAVGTTTYEICANFRTSNIGDNNNSNDGYNAGSGVNSSAHNSGYQCLRRQVYIDAKPVN